jgi:hypothetical protein
MEANVGFFPLVTLLLSRLETFAYGGEKSKNLLSNRGDRRQNDNGDHACNQGIFYGRSPGLTSKKPIHEHLLDVCPAKY